MAWWSLSIAQVWTNLIHRDKQPSWVRCTKPECGEHALKCWAELGKLILNFVPFSWNLISIHTSAVHLTSLACKESK